VLIIEIVLNVLNRRW